MSEMLRSELGKRHPRGVPKGAQGCGPPSEEDLHVIILFTFLLSFLSSSLIIANKHRPQVNLKGLFQELELEFRRF